MVRLGQDTFKNNRKGSSLNQCLSIAMDPFPDQDGMTYQIPLGDYYSTALQQQQRRTGSLLQNRRDSNTISTRSSEAQFVDENLASYRPHDPRNMRRVQQHHQFVHHQPRQEHVYMTSISRNYGDYDHVDSPTSQSSRQTIGSRMDPAREIDFDMDDASMPDSVNLRQRERDTARFRRDDYYNRATESSIAEEGVYNIHDDSGLTSCMSTELRRQQRREWRRIRPVSVRFAEDALLYSSEYSFDDVLAMWYDRDTLSGFKNDRKEIVKVLKKHAFHLLTVERTYGDKYCLRGYEPYFSVEGNKEIRKQRKIVLSTVLSEQKRQHGVALNTLDITICKGMSRGVLLDHELLAKTCFECSKWARDYAFELAAQDTNEVVKDCGYDIKSRNQRQLWDRIIERAVESVNELHEQQLLEAAMKFSMIDQQQQYDVLSTRRYDDGQYYRQGQSDAPQHQYHTSNQDELFQMQRDQLMILDEHKRSQRNNRGDQPSHEVAPQEDLLFRLQQDQLRVLQEEQDRRTFNEQQNHQQDLRSQYVGNDNMRWQVENSEDIRRNPLQHQQRHDFDQEQHDIRTEEHQQMMRVRQMEHEQQRQKEQLRLMMEEQMRLEEHLLANGGDIDEDLANALRVVQMDQS